MPQAQMLEDFFDDTSSSIRAIALIEPWRLTQVSGLTSLNQQSSYISSDI
jgi:hypothetical protein